MAYLVYFKYKNLNYEVAVQTDDIAESIIKLSNTLFPQLEQYSICMLDGTIGTNDGKIYFKYRKIDKISIFLACFAQNIFLFFLMKAHKSLLVRF